MKKYVYMYVYICMYVFLCVIAKWKERLKGVLLGQFPNFVIRFLQLHSYVDKGYCQIEGGTAGIVPQLFNQYFKPSI